MPLDILHLFPIKDQELKAVKSANLVRSRGRVVQAEEAPFSHWKCTFGVDIMNRQQSAAFQSYLMQISPGGETFLCYDLLNPRPILEDTGSPLSGTKAIGGSFTGIGEIDTIISTKEVNISNLPAGFQLSIGDYVEFFNSSTVKSLHVIKEAVTANGSGEATIKFNHGLDIGTFNTDSQVNFEKPSCIMQRIEQGNRSVQTVTATGSWEAEEVFYGS